MKNTIVFKKVSLKIEDKIILRDLSFSVSSEKSLCIIGTGSSGKSSLLKSMLGLVKISSGTIYINGKSISDKKIRSIFNTFGVVFQKDALFDSLTVWENIMFRSLNTLSKEQLIKKSYSILKKVGLERNDAFLVPAELSGGMRKRVAIARAISHNPKFLVLDEPTAGLDPIKTNVIFNIIKKLSKINNTTLIVVTSDMRSVLKYFEEVLVLENSSLHWWGSVSQVKKKPTKHLKMLFEKIV